MTIDPGKTLLRLYEAETENSLDDAGRSRLFDEPIWGVADASDPWFARLKQVIGDHHWTPQEALGFGDPQAPARSVICWCLPVGETPRASNRDEKVFPSREWAFMRGRADGILLRMARGMEEALRRLGHVAVAPAQLSPRPVESVPVPVLSSRWSQRHVGFVAGLGTFGISGGLITRRGVAHRMGSVVTDAELAPMSRPYGDDPFAWCLKASRGTCGACIARCPVLSVGESVYLRDRMACANHRETIRSHARERFGRQTGHFGCGLCQTRVPCELRNPTADVHKPPEADSP